MCLKWIAAGAAMGLLVVLGCGGSPQLDLPEQEGGVALPDGSGPGPDVPQFPPQGEAGVIVAPDVSTGNDPDVVVQPPNDGGPLCGNGMIETGEQCDDDNTRPGDGCNGVCQRE